MSEPDYWQSEEGILDRIGLLADDVRLGTFNNATKIYATAVGVTDFTVSGEITGTSCAWCIMHVGQTYHRGLFMPQLPKHPNCVHYYDLGRVGAKPEDLEGMLTWLFS
jgi:hypothetical protein